MALLQEIKVPLLSVNDTSLTVVEITGENGRQVHKGEQLMVFETSKTTYEVLAEIDGFIRFSCVVDQEYPVNAVVARIYSEANEIPESTIEASGPETTSTSKNGKPGPQAVAWEGEALFSEEAVKLMAAAGIDKTLFNGMGFVSGRDVRQKMGDLPLPASKNTNQPAPAAALQKQVLPVDDTKAEVEKIAGNKRREMEYLSHVQHTGLTSTVHSMVDTEGIFTHIDASLKFLKHSLLPVVVYETARLLQKYRALNGYFTGDAIAFYKAVHIGFAIDIDNGLKVLKIPDTAQLSIPEIEGEIMQLSEKYLDNSLQVSDLTDITFTITDLSAEGVAFFKPLVNMMNSAILGISAIDEKAQRCMLSCTFDHRVTEGKTVARFLNELRVRLESYRSAGQSRHRQDVSCFRCLKMLGEDLSDVGFVKCITPEGKDGYLCQSCLKGF